MDENTYWVAVVDDDIPNLKIAGSVLSENGMRVTALNSGRALTERVKGGMKPDLILLDILMPDMDGFETLAELRRLEGAAPCKPVPVIFLTADDNKETREKALSLGAADIIQKPFDADTLVRKAESILSGANEPLSLPEGSVHAESLRQKLNEQFSPFTERSGENGAFIADRSGFGAINRFIARYSARYGGNVRRVLLSVSPAANNVPDSEIRNALNGFETRIGMLLRKSDVIYSCSPDTYLLLLPMVSDDELNDIMGRIIRTWSREYEGSCRFTMSFVSDSIGTEREKRPVIDGIDWRYAQMNLQNDKLLTNAVREFAESMPDRIDRLEKYFSMLGGSDALNAYRIEVHAMKSAAATIGLLPLSGAARMLEEYARDGRISCIRALHPLFAGEWNNAYINICKAFGFNIRDQNKEKAARVSPALLDVLKTGIENMDTEAVDGALTKIMSYDHAPETAAALEKLKKAAIEFDDSAFEIIKELLK